MKGKERTALYRYYDSEDHLLYVGVSLHAIQRMAQHRQEKPWYEEVTRVDIEYYPSRAEAERAERFAIQQERPQHNIQHAIVDGEPVEHFTYDDLVKKLFYWEQSQKFYAAYDYKKRQEEMTCELHSTFFEVLATSFPEMKKYAGQRKPHAPSRVFVNALSAQYQEYFRDDYRTGLLAEGRRPQTQRSRQNRWQADSAAVLQCPRMPAPDMGWTAGRYRNTGRHQVVRCMRRSSSANADLALPQRQGQKRDSHHLLYGRTDR